MFPQKTIEHSLLKEFFDQNDNCFGKQNRPVEYFFHDVQRTLDEAGLETLQVFLLTARRSIYQGNGGDLTVLNQYALQRCDDRIHKAAFLFDCCDTLTYAEKQQKAFERQVITNGRAAPDFFQCEVPYTFFEHLYELKSQHGFSIPDIPKSDWINNCQYLFDNCRFQPIPAMLLPTVLTIYSTDGKEFSNLYSYFKYKNRRLSVEMKRQVASLFSDICKEVQNQFPCVNKFVIPIFRWPDIEDAFCKRQGLCEEEAKIAKDFFAEYRPKNDLVKSREAKLLEFAYGANIRSLAKLCNLNTYTIMNCLSTNLVPAKAKRPLKLLMEGELLPAAPGISEFQNFDRYFHGMYRHISAIPAFSQLALLRYYRLPMDTYLDAYPDFFTDIEEAAVAALSDYVELLRHNYWLEQEVFEFKRDTEYIWLNKRARARMHYKLGNILERQKYTKHAKAFANTVVTYFTELDYKEFIKQSENFHVHKFPLYLRKFCEKYSIVEYEIASEQEACFLEDEAFNGILDMVLNYFLENIYVFWHKSIERELYT